MVPPSSPSMRRFFWISASLFSPFVALAQQDTITPFVNQMLTLARVAVTIVFVLGVAVFLLGLFSFLFSANNPAAVQKAKGFLLWGVIGLLVGGSLYGFITFLQTYTGIQSGRLIITPPQVN